MEGRRPNSVGHPSTGAPRDHTRNLQFSEALLDWMREALRQSPKEKAEDHRCAIERLNAQYAKLQNRIDQIYLDRLDGEVEEAFYGRNVSAWREEQARYRDSGPFRRSAGEMLRTHRCSGHPRTEGHVGIGRQLSESG